MNKLMVFIFMMLILWKELSVFSRLGRIIYLIVLVYFVNRIECLIGRLDLIKYLVVLFYFC